MTDDVSIVVAWSVKLKVMFAEDGIMEAVILLIAGVSSSSDIS